MVGVAYLEMSKSSPGAGALYSSFSSGVALRICEPSAATLLGDIPHRVNCQFENAGTVSHTRKIAVSMVRGDIPEAFLFPD